MNDLRVARVDLMHYQVSDRTTGLVYGEIRLTRDGWLGYPRKGVRFIIGPMNREQAAQKLSRTP